VEDKDKILIASCDVLNLVILNHILSREYVVFTARSGGEALRYAINDAPNLVLLDVAMSDLSVLEVLLHLRKIPGNQDVPVIVISDDTGNGDKVKIIEQAIMLGAADCVTKPFIDVVVKARVNAHLLIVHQERVIEELSRIDSLTDIPNLKNFDDHLAQEWRRAARGKKTLSFLKMDVDKLKEYNNAYGYSQGDALLKMIAQISASAVKRPTDMAARLGDEEFGILLPDTDLEGAMTVAESIRSAVESARIPTANDRSLGYATISIGATSWNPANGGTTMDFIAKANENLNTAKNAGRNKVIGTDALRAYGNTNLCSNTELE